MSVDERDADGRTALHRAAADGDVAAAKALLARGADPNARDRAEATPLHHVIHARDDDRALALARVLVEAGADPRARNASGRMPSQLGYASDVQTFLRREAMRKPKGKRRAAVSPARASLRSDVERRIDDACRALGHTRATHDHVLRRDEALLVFETGRHAFARIDRLKEALDVRDGDGWRAIPFADLPADPGPLVKESLRVAGTPRLAPVTSVRVHPILKGALEKATAEERPPERPHLGGPTPVCPSIATANLSVWMAERAIELIRPADADEALAIVAMAKQALATPGRRARTGLGAVRAAAAGTPEHDYGQLLAASRDKSRDSEALGLARRAVGAAASLMKGKHDVVWVHAKGSAIRMVSVLRASGGSVTDFLRELDRRILIAEMASAAARHAEALEDLVIERVRWRGPDLFLGQLAGPDRFCLVGKLGRRWVTLTGTKEEMLASVPDFAFEDAALAEI